MYSSAEEPVHSTVSLEEFVFVSDVYINRKTFNCNFVLNDAKIINLCEY